VIWRCRDRVFALESRTLVMGIVNVTPDSFSDGGKYLDPSAAIARCRQLLEDGADLIDIGAESTRPGSLAVPAEEQIRRLTPVLEALAPDWHTRPEAALSIDTASAAVAEAALALGAHVINDTSALRDPAMAAVVAHSGAGLVLMHMRGTPQDMQRDPRYDDVVREVSEFLESRRAAAIAAGVADEAIALDPGIGFGKTSEHSLQLLAGTRTLAALGRPVLVGASRKSFLARIAGTAPTSAPEQRVDASLAAAAIAAYEGARILRVHDVAQTVRVARVADAARAAKA
jgi:dihydropteroate synthase